jgi:hypothetical protein
MLWSNKSPSPISYIIFNIKLLPFSDISPFLAKNIHNFLSLGVLPHALRTRCARCTKIQKQKALDVITRLYYEHPSVYISLAEKYDPNGDYTKNFEEWFDEQNGVKPRPPIPDLENKSE